MSDTSIETRALQARLANLEAKKAARAAAWAHAELEQQVKKAEREDEEETFQTELAESMPDKELGVHFDFSRFGNHLVGYAHNRGAHDIFVKKLPDKGQANPSEVRNFVNRSLVRTDDEADDPAARGAAFDAIAAEFPGAPAAIANVLLDLAKGGTAVRAGK